MNSVVTPTEIRIDKSHTTIEVLCPVAGPRISRTSARRWQEWSPFRLMMSSPPRGNVHVATDWRGLIGG
jgi:hypothetical protein